MRKHTSGRRSPKPSSQCRPTSTTTSARRPRTQAPSQAWKSYVSSTSPRRLRWPTAWTRRAARRSSCSTWAAARSMSPSWRWATACSRYCPRAATPSWAAPTWTTASSTSSPTSSRRTTASTSATTRWPCSVYGMRRRRRRSSCPAPCRRRSTSRSSPPTPTAPSTSMSCSPVPSSKSWSGM